MRASLAFALVAILVAGGLTGCLGGKGDEPTPAAAKLNNSMKAANATVDDGTNNSSMQLTGAGAMPHTHDYWLGKERITIMDQDIDVGADSALGFTFFDIFGGTPGVGGAMIQLPDGTTVFEGTGKLEFTATWTAPTITGATLRYRSAATPDFTDPKALASGTVFGVDVTPEMSDMPHAKSSRWAFLVVPGTGQSIVGSMHIKIDIVRMRNIELFPGHPDLFAGAHQLTLFDGTATSSQQNFATQALGFVTGSAKAAPERGVASQKVVPMNAMSMSANVTIVDATSNVGKVADVNFTVKTADSNGFRPAHLVHADAATNTYTFAWLVDMRQSDSPYAKESQWRFDLHVGTSLAGSNAQCGSCADTKTDYKLVVQAFDSPIDGAKALPNFGRGG